MNEPILKSHWERLISHVDLDITQAAHLLLPYTKEPIEQLILLSDGCVNTNYKVTFKKSRPPIVIRIYIRDKSALYRELGIHQLVESIVPVSRHLFTDDRCNIYNYPYAIMEWIDGILMREVILANDKKAISQCAFEAGVYLDKLRQIKFSQGGFFQENMEIRPFNHDELYLPYATMLLQNPTVKESLGSSLHSAVETLIINNAHILPNHNDANLTHSDYDPANMLVKKMNGEWKIAAILDWEFAHAGTYLLDIGLMLRYSHKLPTFYEQSFIDGIQHGESHLPPHWKKQAKLMDILCLLQLVCFNPSNKRPHMNRDVVSLIADTVNNWVLF